MKIIDNEKIKHQITMMRRHKKRAERILISEKKFPDSIKAILKNKINVRNVG